MAIPDAWGLKYQEVVGLTWLSYKANGNVGDWIFPNVGSRWTVTNIFERGSFRAALITGRKRILSLAGTDDKWDWGDNIGQGLAGVSVQYIRALRLARSAAPDIVVGHSLGGGMASYCAVYGSKFAATINPAPLNINPFSGIGMIRNSHLVINYVAPGEALDVLDHAAITMRRVGKIYHVKSNGGFNPINRHLLGFLDGFVAPQRV